MNRCALSSVVLCALPFFTAAPAPAQTPEPAANRAVDLENTFYRAFYLYRGERRHQEALELYEKFLAAAPEHRFTKRAVLDSAAILGRMGKQEARDTLRAKWAKVLGTANEKPADDRAADAPRDRPQPSAAGGDQPLAARDRDRAAQLRERLTGLKEELAAAVKAGDDERVTRLERQIVRVEQQLAGGGDRAARNRGRQGDRGGQGRQGGGRGQRGQGRAQANFAEMDDAAIQEWIKTTEERQTRMMERLREFNPERADEMEKQWNEIKKLLADGKKEAAQKKLGEMMPRRRRR